MSMRCPRLKPTVLKPNNNHNNTRHGKLFRLDMYEVTVVIDEADKYKTDRRPIEDIIIT